MTLHPHQSDLISEVQGAYQRGARAVLLQLATGGGKTHCAAHGLILPSVPHGRRFVFAAHLEELLEDTAGRLRAQGVPCGVVKAGRPQDPTAPVQVCSTPTLARMLERGEQLPPADRVILDEAHRSSSATNRAVLGWYRERGALLLGLSASPARGDDQPLDEFEAMVCGPTFQWLIAHGYLVQPVLYSPAKILDKGVAEHPVEVVTGRAATRRCVIFAPTAADATAIAEELTARGHATEAVLDGTDPDVRRSVRGRLASGETRHVVTVRALLEGFDAPVMDCAILCGAFTTIAPYLQAVGRVVRAFPGKVDAWVYDLRGAVYHHGLPEADRAWSLAGAQGRAVGGEQALDLRRCKACHAVCGAVTRCPRCGSVMLADTRPMRVQRAALWDQRDVPVRRRAEVYLMGAVHAMRRRRPDLSEGWARAVVLKKCPAWVREALAEGGAGEEVAHVG